MMHAVAPTYIWGSTENRPQLPLPIRALDSWLIKTSDALRRIIKSARFAQMTFNSKSLTDQNPQEVALGRRETERQKKEGKPINSKPHSASNGLVTVWHQIQKPETKPH
jgi:hypothetical protein